jgi:hypothetical protein
MAGRQYIQDVLLDLLTAVPRQSGMQRVPFPPHNMIDDYEIYLYEALQSMVFAYFDDKFNFRFQGSFRQRTSERSRERETDINEI